MVSGWLFDTYSIGDKMVSWIKNDRSITRIEDNWTPSIYVACDDKTELVELESKISRYIKDATLVERFEKVTDIAKSKVLQLVLKNSFDILRLAKTIESSHKFGKYRLYNVDVSPVQSYFYEHDIFPLGKYKDVWTIDDNVKTTDYVLPNFKIAYVSVNPKKESKLPKFSDKIDFITINKTNFQTNDEAETILDFVKSIEVQDPDFIITKKGDTFDFPYLIHRAQQNNVSERLVLGRERQVSLTKPLSKGSSYFSYGRMYFKPSAIKLLGRIHIDTGSCFIWNDEYDLHGLYEISRVCRMPLQIASRASIGKCMSSIQFYNATKRGLLIPWKPTMAEAFKSRKDLLIGDRGGLIFEPEIGVFENVAELDFASLYATIMEKKNISAETILCKCCPDSKNRVPELDYNICQRLGIVPQSLNLLLEKRKLYTKLLEKTLDKEKLKIYDARKSALKWILVTSFGYLGFNNAKFGRIDAHMAVCAFARKLLLQAVRIAENHGFRVLHGIVDSLWLYKKGSTRDDAEKVRIAIQNDTGFEMSLDIYKWLVFLPSKQDETIPVLNRYFGAFESGKLKVRGIELRRHDIPLFFKRCQNEILELFATGNNIVEVRDLFPQAVEIYKKYLKFIVDGKVSFEELSFTSRASKNVEDYKSNTIQTDAMLQLMEEGELVKAGQKIQYVITDYSRKRKRSIPIEMISSANYDVKKYAELLAEYCLTITQPFGMTDLTNEDKNL